MQKIIFVITKSNWGGAQRYVYDLVTTLHRPHAERPTADFEVSVAFGQSGRLSDELQKAGITTHPILSLQRDVSVIADVKSFFELVQLFKKECPDIVHLNSSKAGGIGALAARMAGVHKIIFTAHGWPFWEKRNFVSKTLIYLFSWFTALLSHKVIVVSNSDLRVAQKMPFVGKKTIRIYNGIDERMSFSSGEKIRNAFPSGVHITGTIGELNKNKNQQVLIDEAKNNPDLFVAIVGEGEERAALKEKIKKNNLGDRVKLFGFMPASEVLRGFDTFALPSVKEGLPYVLIEAKLAGLPIEANRVGGVGEILDARDMSEFSLVRMVEKTTALYLAAAEIFKERSDYKNPSGVVYSRAP